jgi:hypothetical protein
VFPAWPIVNEDDLTILSILASVDVEDFLE